MNVLLGLLSGLVVVLLASELGDWTSRIALKLCRFAVRKLPEPEKEQVYSELRELVDQVPGGIPKLVYSVSLPFRMRALRRKPKGGLDQGKQRQQFLRARTRTVFLLFVFVAATASAIAGIALNLVSASAAQAILAAATAVISAIGVTLLAYFSRR